MDVAPACWVPLLFWRGSGFFKREFSRQSVDVLFAACDMSEFDKVAVRVITIIFVEDREIAPWQEAGERTAFGERSRCFVSAQ